MPTKTTATVTWEIVGEVDENGARVVVDVEAPLRPFGSMPTPPKGLMRPGVTHPAEPISAEQIPTGEGDATTSGEGDSI